MSDGGKLSGTDNESSFKKGKQTGRDDFERAVSRIAVAQICESAGFQGAQRSALDALADVAIRYISCLGKAAHYYANISCRTECNVFDMIQGLEDIIGSSQGFGSSSDPSRCLVGSGVLRDISHFVSTTEEVPFLRPIPRFPVARHLKPAPSFVQIGETPPGKHVPDWLPAFPDSHTYLQTPVWYERATDPQADKLVQARQRRKAEKSLLGLQQRIASISAAGSVSAVSAEDLKGKQIAENNPFLLPPLPSDAKQITSVAIPKCDAPSKRLSILETFAPVIEAAKTGSLECGGSERRPLPNKRAPVHFRIGVDKKLIAVPLSSGVLGNRSDSWFLRDDQKDDKKRRAEMILKESMENPQELIQL